ncbi:hypothetical protein EW146_g3908 [Bondarzewia mesenterica]|uniref:RNA helicase n=1 Tax=Bondarzewia mesenterica TaxID=1095465 RepID=A0A4S4LY02_9AGAM|nr:hypothetical protein EW146_g3908 [Bondarzewia mesenterica]
MAVEVASTEAPVSLKRKKSKTDPTGSSAKKEKKIERPEETGEDGDTHEHDDDARQRKKQKREEKERRRKEKEDAAVDPARDFQVIGDEDEKQEKRKRKKEKKSKESSTMDAEGSAVKSGRQKKKRKRDDPIGDVESTDHSVMKKDKKKKEKDQRKKQRSEMTATEPSTSTLPPAPTPSAAEVEAYLAEHSITLTIPQGASPITPALSFSALRVPDALQTAFTGFDKPTPVQACAWPPALEGRDVVGIAETGSGKTLAFGIPALARLMSSPSSKKFKSKSQVSVLVLAPTRELAIQTHDTLAALGSSTGIGCIAVFGGVEKGPQVRALKSGETRIVVGTPGRILDLVREGACDLSEVNYLVLDEADRMLDKGFENDIRAIIGYTKEKADRQTLMFSATWPDVVRRLAASFQRDPVRVTIGSDDLTANSHVEQIVEVFDDEREKDSRLVKHLKQLAPNKKYITDPEAERILVFVLYKKEATRVESMLKRMDYTVAALHGDLSQSARMQALQSFRDGATRLLVATDVAARGLDIPNVACVINYSFPLTIEDYIHRIGRTGRGGRSGKSITFFTGDKHERSLAGELARVLRDSGFECPGLQKFPMAIKKKTHSVYGAFFRDDLDMTAVPKKIVFDS